MSRSLKKPLFTLELKNPKWFKRFEKANQEGKKITFKTWYRGIVISPNMIGHVLLIHNGKKFVAREVSQDMVGYKIGVFAPTRQMGTHGKAGTH